MKHLAYLAIIVTLVSCGTSEITKRIDDTYIVTSQYGSMNGSWDRAAKESLEKAVVFCDGRRQKMSLLDERRMGIYGISPQRVDITFRCVDHVNLNSKETSTTEEKLTKVKALYSKGLLTEAQYNEQVKTILNTN